MSDLEWIENLIGKIVKIRRCSYVLKFANGIFVRSANLVTGEVCLVTDVHITQADFFVVQYEMIHDGEITKINFSHVSTIYDHLEVV